MKKNFRAKILFDATWATNEVLLKPSDILKKKKFPLKIMAILSKTSCGKPHLLHKVKRDVFSDRQYILGATTTSANYDN